VQYSLYQKLIPVSQASFLVLATDFCPSDCKQEILQRILPQNNPFLRGTKAFPVKEQKTIRSQFIPKFFNLSRVHRNRSLRKPRFD